MREQISNILRDPEDNEINYNLCNTKPTYMFKKRNQSIEKIVVFIKNGIEFNCIYVDSK